MDQHSSDGGLDEIVTFAIVGDLLIGISHDVWWWWCPMHFQLGAN
jgi:hypothetical protein